MTEAQELKGRSGKSNRVRRLRHGCRVAGARNESCDMSIRTVHPCRAEVQPSIGAAELPLIWMLRVPCRGKLPQGCPADVGRSNWASAPPRLCTSKVQLQKPTLMLEGSMQNLSSWKVPGLTSPRPCWASALQKQWPVAWQAQPEVSRSEL